MKSEKISVVMPAYNAEQFIDDALDSVLAQTYQNFEIIIVNDGSSDRTGEVVKSYIDKDNRIKLLNQKHSGTACARNLGINNAKGSLIAFLDADDVWHPDKLTKQIAFMYKESGSLVKFVSCLALIIDDKNISQGLISGRVLEGNCYRKMLEEGGISGGSIVLVRKECLDEVGGFDSLLEPYEDWDMWIRLTRSFKIATVPEILVGYRRSNSCSSRNYKRLMHSGRLVLMKAFNKDQSLSKNYYNFCFARDVVGIGAWCLLDGQYKEAKRFAIKATKINFLALITGFQRFGFFVVLILAFLIPKKIFKKLIMEKFLPSIFRLKHGVSFFEVCK